MRKRWKPRRSRGRIKNCMGIRRSNRLEKKRQIYCIWATMMELYYKMLQKVEMSTMTKLSSKIASFPSSLANYTLMCKMWTKYWTSYPQPKCLTNFSNKYTHSSECRTSSRTTTDRSSRSSTSKSRDTEMSTNHQTINRLPPPKPPQTAPP